jgi:hypothetical protein
MKQNIYEPVWKAEKCTWSSNEAKYRLHNQNSVNISSQREHSFWFMKNKNVAL